MSNIYCFRCKKYTDNKKSAISQTTDAIAMISSNCFMYNNKKIALLKNKKQKDCEIVLE